MDQQKFSPATLASFLLPQELPESPSSTQRDSAITDALSPSIPTGLPIPAFPNADALLDSGQFSDSSVLMPEIRAQMAEMVDGPELLGQGHRGISLTSSSVLTGLPAHFSSLVPSLVELTGRILHELEMNLPRLLSLNPSRREAVAQHLDRLAGLPSAPSTLSGNADPAGGLRRWIEGPRSTAQNAALQTYFEEIALVTLGQAILLKAWSDRGIRSWNENDLGRLNWALSTALKPHVPLDREGWQITRPNLYSWYNPSAIIQREAWNTLECWRITDEGPSFLVSLLGPTRRAHPQVFEPQGYDARFFKCIWENLPLFGLDPTSDPGPIRRTRAVFCPTLRDGSMVRTGPVSLSWVGMESSPFQLLLAELVQLWWGPAAPPFWAMGTGLEVHGRDQLALALGSPKPSLLSRITEMEACDIAFVLEERPIRTQGRAIEAVRFKEQVELLPYFKKLRSTGTTLGDLQACVALSKLRPGGLLFWAREEALSAQDGTEVLNFILERSKIVCEWDLSQLEHSLPVAIPLFPKHLYLISRESNIENRLTHRPLKLTLQGQIRSHVELPLVLEDALQAYRKQVQPRGHWQIHSHASPTSQREWAERWPDPTCQNSMRQIENLRSHSAPLANFTTIRPTPDGDPNREHAWSVSTSIKGFWVSAESTPEGRRLVTHPLPRPSSEAKGSGYIILVSDENWIAPLSNFLQSDIIHTWLEHHAERRSGKWILNDQVMKWIPIPKPLLKALGVSAGPGENPRSDAPFALPLPGDWEKLASEVAYQPKLVREALVRLPKNEQGQEIRATLFVRASRALEHLRQSHERLFTLVSKDGKIRWRELLDILPKHECVQIPFHPRVKLLGTLPPHLPIGKIERAKSPLPGISLATESGFYLHVGSDSPMIAEMLWDQVQGLVHPTWNELLRYLRLPRRLEIAEATAADIIRSHGEHSMRLQELSELVSACSLF